MLSVAAFLIGNICSKTFVILMSYQWSNFVNKFAKARKFLFQEEFGTSGPIMFNHHFSVLYISTQTLLGFLQINLLFKYFFFREWDYFFLHKSRKLHIRRNNSKVGSIETRRIVIADLYPWSDLEKCMYKTLF